MRRRMLSPDFFTDPDIVANLDFAGRLFYQGLWCIAEDSGVFEPNPLAMKMKIFPGDNLDIEVIRGYYETLKRLNKLIEFEVNGRIYAWIKNFHKHQKLDRPSPPSLPLPKWIVWHGEEEYGKEKHRWHYEVLIECLQGNNQIDDNSTTIRRTVEEQDTIEEKRKEEKLKEEKRREEKPSLTPPQREASAAKPPAATLESLYSRYSPDQQKIIDDYWEIIRFTRKSAKLAESIKITEMEYWSRYPPDVVIQALNIHRQRYQTKDERYTRGIIRRLHREIERGVNNGQFGTSRASPGNAAGAQDYDQFVLR
ncbi:MAG: hypothetical protein AB2448_01675 [Moorella sp. (in: firmicutes)]